MAPLRPLPDPSIPRPALIYAFPVYDFDPDTGLVRPPVPDPQTGQLRRRVRWDYVGQTVRGRHVREAEHLDDKPWADLVAGPSVVVDQGVWTKDERDAREVAAIKRLRPRLNHDENLDNPQRIEIWRQLEHRHARDRAAGRPPWLTVEQRLDAERNSITVLEAHRRRTDRTPGELAWDVACAVGRHVAGWPRRLQLTVLALTLWCWAVWGSASLAITYAHWPQRLAWIFMAVLNAVALLGPLRSKPVRRWVRRGRRRRR